jgi:serine/threonine protein kinase
MGNKQSRRESKSKGESKTQAVAASAPTSASKGKSKKSKDVYVIGKTAGIKTVYNLGARLGQPGQFGYAQACTHKKTGKKYAVKVISKARFKPSQYDIFRRYVYVCLYVCVCMCIVFIYSRQTPCTMIGRSRSCRRWTTRT